MRAVPRAGAAPSLRLTLPAPDGTEGGRGVLVPPPAVADIDPQAPVQLFWAPFLLTGEPRR